jgi:SAM-dependent methyltransferase
VPQDNAQKPSVGEASFDALYYQTGCGSPYVRNPQWLAFFGGIADRIVSGIRPARVLDAGCALGFLVETLRDRGVDATGIDLSSYAIEHVYEPIRPFCRLGSIAEPFPGRYDLIVSIEVVEHMPAREAERAIQNICEHADDVLFSSTPYDYRETTHVNVHGPEYWAEQFARHGFYRDVDFDASFVTAWAVRFRKRTDPVSRIVRDYERLHAEAVRENIDVRAQSTELQHQLGEALRERDLARQAEPALADAKRRIHQLEEDRNDLTLKLGEALRRVVEMERSAFWKARMALARLRARVGGR